jgi:hypothetical protein
MLASFGGYSTLFIPELSTLRTVSGKVDFDDRYDNLI